MTKEASSHMRRASEKDVPAVTALVRGAYEKYVERIGREPKPMAADYRSALAWHQVWVIDDGGKILAVLELIPASDHLLVENIAVGTQQQGNGIGRRLMAFAESEARRQGFIELRLYTNERFVENLAFYRRLGYHETHRELFHGTQLVHMAKRI